MFTGIVTDMGEVMNIRRETSGTWGDTRMTIACHYDADDINLGASIANNGACMTVVEKGHIDSTSSDYKSWYSFDVSDESLSRTTLKDWREGQKVNLERALTAQDELGGHLVSGHVDATAKVIKVLPVAGSITLGISLPEEIADAVAPKGSITIDGVSLTVNSLDLKGFEVNIIPHTAKVTTLGQLSLGDKVNLEIDLIARYVTRYLRLMKERDEKTNT